MGLFYFENTTDKERKNYLQLLEMMGSLSNLFSDNTKPYLNYRVAENVFCISLNADNLSRDDTPFDARKNKIGIGIKTWIGGDLQKIEEFNKFKREYENDTPKEMIRKIATYRNNTIAFHMRAYDLHNMIYHCIIRDKNLMRITECPMEYIDIGEIHSIHKNNNIITFSDNLSEYSFNTSKSTLYKHFSNLVEHERVQIDIIKEPYSFLSEKLGYIRLIGEQKLKESSDRLVYLSAAILPLYSTKHDNKYVPEKNNLNMRFAGGRKRNPFEVGIPIPADFRHAHPDFFPGINYPFQMILPNGDSLTAKQCQQDGKSLMSNPNSDLGKWLIKEVLQISEDKLITYEMLERYGIDSVRLEKYQDVESNKFVYRINFAKVGSYERFMGYKNKAEAFEEDMTEDDLFREDEDLQLSLF